MKEQLAAKIETVQNILSMIDDVKKKVRDDRDKFLAIEQYVNNMNNNYKETMELVKKMASM
jgi:uncharacterized phage infection (PIP) family protein YhgE